MIHDFNLWEKLVGKRCDEVAAKIENDKSLLIAVRALNEIADRDEWKDQAPEILAAAGRIFKEYDRRKKETAG